MGTGLVSVIVPVYNKAVYLKKCFQSIVEQSYANIELIVIDDCSTDMSYAISKEFADSNENVRLFRNEKNLGHYKSRFDGVLKAKGDWVTFVDADDWLEPEAVERLYDAARGYDVDMVQMRHQRNLKGVSKIYQEVVESSLLNRKIMGEEFLALTRYIGIDSLIAPSCWGKIYRKEIFKEIGEFSFNQFWGEDQVWNIHYLRYARSIAFIDYIGYNYRWGGETSNYKFTMLSEFKNVHCIKRLMGQDEELISDELKKLLLYHVRQLMSELGWTKEAVVYVLKEELRDPLWIKIGVQQTAEEIVEQEYDSIQRNPLKYWAKRILR